MGFPEDMFEHLLSVQDQGQFRTAEEARNFSVEASRPDSGAAAPKPPEHPPGGGASLHESIRSLPGISSRNGQNTGKGTRYRYDMGERQNSAAHHNDGTYGAFRRSTWHLPWL